MIVLVLSTTVFVSASTHANPGDNPVHAGCCFSSEMEMPSLYALQDASIVLPDGRVVTVDEYLDMINSGYITPLIIVSEIEHNVSDMVSANSDGPFPWTSCSNFFGHSWGNWGAFRQSGPIGHSSGCGSASALCTMPVHRFRHCQRSGCNDYQTERSTIFARCFM